MTPEFIRNAISAAAIALSVGGSVAGWALSINNNIATLQTSLTKLSDDMLDMRCELHPDLRVCYMRTGR